MEEFDLKAYVKQECAITWDDTSLDSQIEEAKAYLRDISGTSISFDAPGTATSLLKNRVRYDRNGALALFETDFRSSLLRFQLSEGLKGGVLDGESK
ncbi:hypothetical protein HCJ39_13155 [Listeria rocourtiae]|uniref:hypothetical protein n=1 Tax=Listeria rocourtiae TaxID=647910 RepID=UPI001623CD0C|nr:hypothetical protein [Listeria rocourtiae]MBC1605662.1 hypothetical protein [Listeria rocourtiae]